jgi:hypothetical protein
MTRRERFSDSSTADAAGSRSASLSSANTAMPQPAKPPCYDGEMVARALPRSRAENAFNGVKLFSATKFAERDTLGDRVTLWLREHPDFEIIDMLVTQSSDAEFHCVTISVFYFERLAPRVGR